MKCKEIEKYLGLSPNDIDSDIREEVNRHVQSCNKCRELVKKLAVYRNYVESGKEVEVPENFEMKVLKNFSPERKSIQRKQLYVKIGFALSSAAILLIAFLLFKPADKLTESVIETNFVLKLEKKGKGPSDAVDFKNIDNAVKSIISETGSEIVEYKSNSLTSYYDYIMVSVPKDNIPEFIEKYNAVSTTPINIPKGSNAEANKMYLKIYFDMVNFTVGNFDGDKQADIIAQFISGKYKGEWLLYKNSDSTHFKEGCILKMGDDENKYLGDFWLLSGDFNGDGYDDICLYEYSSNRGLTLYTLLNNHDNSFRKAPANFMKLSIPTEEEFVKIVVGDADGNGIDDLIWIAKINRVSYRLTAINIDKSFGMVNLPDIEDSGGIIIAGDLNGDKYFDLCIKYPGGKLGGETNILLNNHDFTFTESYFGRLSFQGDYLFWCDDYNGDGFDDLIVKSGGLFIAGYWYVLPNNSKADFYKEGIQFTITYPME